MMTSEYPFASAKAALNRIREDFHRIRDDGIDPSVVLIHARRPVPHELYLIDWGLLHHPDPKKRISRRRDFGSSSDATDERTRVLGGWSIPDGHPTLPGCERWFFVYSKPDDVNRIKIPSEELMFLCVKQGAMIAEKLLSIPDGSQYGWHQGYWFDVVFEVARRSLNSVPSHTWAVPLTDDLQFDWEWNGKLIPDPWTKPDPPPGWTMRLDRFCTSSIDLINLLILWGESGVSPFESQPDAQAAAGGQLPADAGETRTAESPMEENADVDRACEPLTPLQTKIVRFLWERKHATNFNALAQYCWANGAEDENIVTCLKRVRKRWVDCGSAQQFFLQLDFDISPGKRTVKLIRPGQKKGQK